MAREAIPSVAKDLDGVLQYLRKANLIGKNPAEDVLVGIKKLHRATYSLILWRFRLQGIPGNARPFIEEIASDALQILPQALAGYIKTTHLLTRGIIENTLRYVYFFDHPVEYRLMNREIKWYVEIKDLFEYATKHPDIARIEAKFDAYGKLKTLYSELSGSVHGRKVEDLEMRVALDKIIFSQDALNKHVTFVERCAEAVNFSLATFHVAKVRSFQSEDRRIILRSISSKGRNVWSALP